MADGLDQLDAEIGAWKRGVLDLGPPAHADDLTALQEAVDAPLPADYVAILSRFDGADLRGDRLLSAVEAIDARIVLAELLAPFYAEDPDWPPGWAPPDHLLPVATDLEGNLKCLDFSTDPPEVVDWHRESGTFTTWHRSVTSWLLAASRSLGVRFDRRGRPRPLRPGETDRQARLEIDAVLEVEPGQSYSLMEQALWLTERSTPEEGLFAFRVASAGWPERAICHYEHARWAIQCRRFAEARRSLRRALAIPADPNPRKHSFRTGHLPAAHTLLAMLYDRVDQRRKADEQRRAADRAAKRYGFGWYSESTEYLRALEVLRMGGEP